MLGSCLQVLHSIINNVGVCCLLEGVDPNVGKSMDGLTFSLCSLFCHYISFIKNNSGLKHFEMGG